MEAFKNSLLMSINLRSFRGPAKSFYDEIRTLDKQGLVSGYEIYHRREEVSDNMFSVDLALTAKQVGWKVQIHGYEVDNISDRDLSFYASLSTILKQKITVTLHPVCSAKTLKDAVDRTIYHFNSLSKKVAAYGLGLDLCLENLEYIAGEKRCGISEIDQIIGNLEHKSICLDLGHIMSSGGKISEISPLLWKSVNNVHVHSVDSKGVNHHPFTSNSDNVSQILSELSYHQYDGNVVVEVAMDYLKAKRYRAKLMEYLHQFYIVSSSNVSAQDRVYA